LAQVQLAIAVAELCKTGIEPDEAKAKVAQQFGVSKDTVRRAVRKFAGEIGS
jgi:hypothetical protein